MIKKISILIAGLIPVLLLAAPVNPSNLSLIPTKDSVTVSWQDNSNDETGFKIYRDDNLIALVETDSTSFIDTGLSSSTTYNYTIKATDDALKINVSKARFAPLETITLALINLPGNKNDWVGIYPKGSSNAWENVVSWSFTNGTKGMVEYGITTGVLNLEGVVEGEYEARLFYNNSFELEDFIEFDVVKDDDGKIKIFVIGDSTVHNDSIGEMGWGSKLGAYTKDNVSVFNQARSGSSSKSYKVTSVSHHDWDYTKEMMRQADIQHGAYLFIQFAHNDEKADESLHTEPGVGNTFYMHLKEYVDEARALGIIPVLITPTSRIYRYDGSHGEYPQTIRELAINENVLMLDLYAKSWNVFTTSYATHEAVFDAFAYDDHTHFDPEGASIVAGWIKELVCIEDEGLCSLFLED